MQTDNMNGMHGPGYDTAEELQCAYIQAVFDERYATASMLRAYLPPIDMSDVRCPPGDDRETFACAGEINA